MLHLHLFFSLVSSVSSLSCPQNYALIRTTNRCIRLLHVSQYDPLVVLLSSAREECYKDRANLPIIKSAEENEVINHIVNSMHELKGRDINLLLDLDCNNATRRLEWTDGSPLSYIPDSRLEIDFDCKDGEWYHVLTDYNMGWPFTVVCLGEPLGSSNRNGEDFDVHTFF